MVNKKKREREREREREELKNKIWNTLRIYSIVLFSVRSGLNTTSEEILQSIANNEDEISPSNIFACAAILEGCPYINGSPQNTLVPGIVDLADKHDVFIGGDDFKSGQTKLKSMILSSLIRQTNLDTCGVWDVSLNS